MNRHTWAVVLLGCAWFLWWEVSEKLPGKSFAHSWSTSWNALESKGLCEVHMQGALAWWEKAGLKATGNSVSRVWPNSKDYQLIQYYCLPDTVDPRQSKR
jgi:hypothetical protein